MKKNLLLGLMAGLAALFSLVVSAEPVADYARRRRNGRTRWCPAGGARFRVLVSANRRAGITNSLRCSRRVADTRKAVVVVPAGMGIQSATGRLGRHAA